MMVEYNDSMGLTLSVFLNSPSNYELLQFKSGKKFEIKIKEFYNILFFVFKFGDMPYMDCAFNPNLYKNDLDLQYIFNKDAGLSLNILIIDSCNGELKHIRTIGLGNKITNKFLMYCKKEVLLKDSFDENKYKKDIKDIQLKYSSLDLAKLISKEDTYTINS